MKQQLSALMDGEADIDRCEHIFLAAKSSGEVAQAWQSYHVIRDVMRDELCVQSDMAYRIMAAIEDEPTLLAPKSKVISLTTATKPLRMTTMGWSVAASFAAAMFVGMFVLNQSPATPPSQIAEKDAAQYVMAHHNFAPSSSTYYVHNVSFNGE